MKLSDLQQDVMARLTPARRAALEQVVQEYGASETFAFLLALVAVSSAREQQLIRLFLSQLDGLEKPEQPSAT